MMMSSEAKVCVPCSGLDDSALLSLDQVQTELKNMPLWKLEEKDGVPCITRHYVTKNFQAALDSINAIGCISERERHHPDLHLVRYREVEIVLWTHKLGGLTKNDMNLAKVFDTEVEIMYSPKWLKEHPEAQTIKGGSA
jgi:4a-hydroxytetrahydrobiopterin dehydratase